MPALITAEEARRLGEIDDHREIEALVARAWEADDKGVVLRAWSIGVEFMAVVHIYRSR